MAYSFASVSPSRLGYMVTIGLVGALRKRIVHYDAVFFDLTPLARGNTFASMSKTQHPFYQWIKANGLKMGYVADQIGTHPRTLGRYLKTGSAPLLFQNAVRGFTQGAIGHEAWETAE